MVGVMDISADAARQTVVAAGTENFTVHLIPVTRRETALRERPEGAAVNLECDILARYVARQLAFAAGGKNSSHVTMQMLLDAGF